MLRRLRIENLVLIREAELAFAPGLNAITGETGAGKTILAQAIGLLLGAREIENWNVLEGKRLLLGPALAKRGVHLGLVHVLELAVVVE